MTTLDPGLDLAALRERFSSAGASPLLAAKDREVLRGVFHGPCPVGSELSLGAADPSDPPVVAGPAGAPLIQVNGDRTRVTLRGIVFRDAHAARGALAVLGNVSKVFLYDCVFFDCEHDDPRPGAGAITVEGGFLRLERCLFWGNTGQTGGAIAVRDASRLIAEGCVFLGNRARAGGGAIYVEDTSSAKLSGCTFVANLAEDALAGQTIHGGGTIYDKGSVSLTNCVIRDEGTTFGHGDVSGGSVEALACLLPPQARDYPGLSADDACAFRVAEFPEAGFPFALPSSQQLAAAALEKDPKPGDFFGAPMAWQRGGVGAAAGGDA